MAIKRKSKINPNFNMSSMTDIFFLLLLFFMISSTLINPNALKLLLPKSTNQTSDKPVVVVSIDKNYTFYLNEKVIPFSMLERRLVEELKEQGKVTQKQYEKIKEKLLQEYYKDVAQYS